MGKNSTYCYEKNLYTYNFMIGMWIRPARIHLNACKARKKIRRNRLGTSLNVIPVVQADLHFANMTTLQQQYSITNELHAS